MPAPLRPELVSHRRNLRIRKLHTFGQARLDTGQMGYGSGMIHVTTKLISGKLPVAWDNPFLHAADNFSTRLGSIEHVVHVECRVAKILAQIWRVFIPVREDQALVGLNPCLARPPLGLVEVLTECLRLIWYVHQVSEIGRAHV